MEVYVKRSLSLTILLVVLISLVLSACGSSATPTAASGSAPQSNAYPAPTDTGTGSVQNVQSYPAPAVAVKIGVAETQGFDYDLIQEIAKRTNLEATFVTVPADGMINSVINCEVDLAIGSLSNATADPQFYFTEAYRTKDSNSYAIAVCKTSQGLIDRLNFGIQSTSDDGTIQSLEQKYP